MRDAELHLAASLQALDRLHGAVLLLGQRGEVLFAKQAALRLLQKGAAVGDTLAIEREIAHTLQFDPTKAAHFPNGLTVQKPSGRGHLVLRMAPLSRYSEVTAALMDPGAVVFVSDTGARLTLDASLLQSLFGIIPAECRLAETLPEGSGLVAAAGRLSISDNTAHSHLKRLFEKPGTYRQAELVRLLMGLVQSDWLAQTAPRCRPIPQRNPSPGSRDTMACWRRR